MLNLERSRLAEADGTLTQRLRELEKERATLREVRYAYSVVERSRFARLRAFWQNLRAMFTRTPANIALLAVEMGADVVPPHGAPDDRRASVDDSYDRWLRARTPTTRDIDRMRKASARLAARPVISILMPTFNSTPGFLRAAIESVRAQAYPDWELCIADDNSSEPSVREVLEEFARRDRRIKVVWRDLTGGISAASNSALELATGDFVGYLDHDDILTPDALFEIASLLNLDPSVDMIYSDEDKIDESGRRSSPFFKPDWSPESFMARMYTCHFGVYRRSLIAELGGLRSQFDGSQDYDLVLRLTERTERVKHIPKVLYNWRAHAGSTARRGETKEYAGDAAVRALNEALERRGEPGIARQVPDCPGTYEVRFVLPDEKALVSIIVPTRDHGDDVERCLTSIFARTTYPNFELLLIDNGSTDTESIATFERWAAADSRVRVLRYDVPFNYSKINNYAVTHARGSYLLLLNNDTEVISHDWIEAMVEYAQRPAIGAVGALLLYGDGTVQHAGVIVGLGGVAGHAHKYFPSDAPGYFYGLQATNNYSAVTGACLMVRADAYTEVGGFDEELEVAFNDVDFCLKLRAAGYRNVYLPHVRLHHYESKSRGLDKEPTHKERFARECATLIARWKTDSRPDPHYSPNLTLSRENFSIRL